MALGPVREQRQAIVANVPSQQLASCSGRVRDIVSKFNKTMRAKHERKLQSLCGMGQVRFSAPENEGNAEEVAFVALATQRSPPNRPMSYYIFYEDL